VPLWLVSTMKIKALLRHRSSSIEPQKLETGTLEPRDLEIGTSTVNLLVGDTYEASPEAIIDPTPEQTATSTATTTPSN